MDLENMSDEFKELMEAITLKVHSDLATEAKRVLDENINRVKRIATVFSVIISLISGVAVFASRYFVDPHVRLIAEETNTITMKAHQAEVADKMKYISDTYALKTDLQKTEILRELQEKDNDEFKRRMEKKMDEMSIDIKELLKRPK